MGRPTRYRPELADAILRGIAGGRTSGDVCAELGLPRQTVAWWRADHFEFRTAYVEAFRARAHGMVEEALDIIDSIPPDADMPRVMREYRRSELRRWTASRLVAAFAETSVHHHTVGNAVVRILLPQKGSSGDGPLLEGELIEGSATEVTATEQG